MKLKLTPKLTLIFVLFAAALLTVVNLLGYSIGRSALQGSAIAELESTAGEKQAALRAWLDEKANNIQSLAEDPTTVEQVIRLRVRPLHPFDATPIHSQLLEEFTPRIISHEFLALMLLDPTTGRVLMATDPKEEGQSRLGSPYFSEGKLGTYLPPIYFEQALQSPAMTIASPVKSKDGHLQGVLAGRVNLKELDAIIQRHSSIHKTIDAFLINNSHQFITQPRFLTDPAVLQQGVYTVPVNRCLEHQSGHVLANDYRGVPVIAVYRWLPQQQMCLIVKLDEAEALADQHSFGINITLISAAALLTASLIALALSRTILKPILTLQTTAQRFGQGDLSVRLPETGADELGSLAHEFNTMAASLAEKENRLREHSLELERRVEERTAELQQSQKRFQALIENAPDGIALLGLDGKLRQVTPSTQQILGYSVEEAQGQDPALLTHPDDLPGLLEVINDLIQNPGKVVRAEYRFRHKDGSWRWLNSTISNLIREPGLEAIVINYRDVTERKQAQGALAESEEKFKYIFNHSVVGKSITHIDGTLEVNQAFCDMLGYSQDELVNKKFHEITHPEDVELSNRVVQLLVSGEKESVRFTKRYIHKTGSVIWGDVSISLRRDAEGKPLYFMTAVVDITERKLAEIQLAESLEFNERILTSSPVGIFTYRLNGQCLSVNAAAAQMVGATIEQLKSQNFHELESWKRSGLYALAQQAIQTREPVAEDVHVLTSFGRDAWYRAQFARFRAGDEDLLLMIFNDITERKQAESALKASEQFNQETLDSLDANIAILDEEGTIVAVNRSWHEFARANGADPALVSEGINYLAVCYAATGPDLEEAMSAAEGIRAVMEGERESFSFEYSCHSPDEQRWFMARVTRFRETTPARIVVAHQYITERKLAEIQLAESLEFTERILTSAPVGILAYKFTGEFVSANAYASQMVGATPEQLQLQNFHELESWKRSGLYDLAQKVIAERTHVGGDIHHITTFGREKWFSVQLVTFKSRGEDLLLVIVNDISERKQAEDTLRRFELLSANSRDIILFVRRDDGHILDANAAAVQAYGYTRDEILSLRVHDLRPDHPEEMVGDQMDGADAGGILFETVHARKDGSLFPVEVSSQGATIGGMRTLVSIVRDMTDRKKAEAALAASEKRFRTWIEHASDIITVMDGSGIIQYESPSVKRLLGYEPEDLLGKNPFEFVHPEDRDGLVAMFAENIQDTNASVTIEFRFRHKDGSWRFLEALGHAFVDEHEEVVALIHSRDITERIQAEEALRASEERFRRYFELGLVGMAITSPTKGWIEVNDEICQILGYTRQELLQMDWARMTHPDDLAADTVEFNRVLTGETDGYSREKRFIGKYDRIVDTIISVRCIRREDGSVDYFLALMQDITDRKHAEEALQEKERLLSEAQHIGQIGSLSYDIPGDRFQFSDEMYHLLDVSPEKFQHDSKDFLALIYPSDRLEAATWFIDLRESWQTRSLDFRLFRRNGELRYLHWEGALEFNSDGKPVRFLGNTQDVTERKLAEIQINQQIKHLTALSEIDRAIISGLDQRQTLDIILSQTLSQLQVDAADILLLAPDGQSLHYAAGQGFHTPLMEKIYVPLGKSFAGRVAQERRRLRVPNLEEQVNDPLFDILVTEEKFVSYVGIPLIIMKEVKGVLEVFHRTPFQPYQEWLDFLNTLAGQATIAVENANLLGNLKASNAELSQAYDATIEGWSHAMDLRDKETEGHTQRVVHLTIDMARGLGIPESKLPHIRRGALLHDIGKLGIPDRILLKPDKLTSEEWGIMQKHPEYAYEMLSPIHYLKPALPIPYFHHERWDGSGYPLGLRGEQIPLEARIFAIVDVWDALRSDRPYRNAWTEERTLEYIHSLAGTQFDPTVVDYFMKTMKP